MGLLGPGVSPQQLVPSAALASSKVTATSMRPERQAGEQDEGHPVLQEEIGVVESTSTAPGLALGVGPGARAVVAVVTQVGGDEPELRGGRLDREIVGQMPGERVGEGDTADRAGRAHLRRPQRHEVGVALGLAVERHVGWGWAGLFGSLMVEMCSGWLMVAVSSG